MIVSYSFLYRKNNEAIYDIKKDEYFTIEDGIKWLKSFFSEESKNSVWKNILDFLPDGMNDLRMRKSAIISILMASLTLVKDGSLIINQKTNFDKIFIKNRIK